MESPAAAGARLQAQLSSLKLLLAGVAPEAFDKRVAGKWSVRENLAHLVRYHDVFVERVRTILDEKEPTFPAYRAELDAEWPIRQATSFEAILDELHAVRVRLIQMLDRLTPDQWERTGTHVDFGILSLRAWVELFLVHEGHHLYVIAKRARGLE